jgi:hypothetical protein
LPPALTVERRVEGIRNPVWAMTPIDGAQRAAVQLTLGEIEGRLVPPRRNWIVAILARLAVHYPNETKDQRAFGLRLSDMADELADYSEAHLVAACAAWRRSQSWWPKLNELRDILFGIRAADQLHKHRAEVLLGLKQPRPWERLPAPVVVAEGDGKFDGAQLADTLKRASESARESQAAYPKPRHLTLVSDAPRMTPDELAEVRARASANPHLAEVRKRIEGKTATEITG